MECSEVGSTSVWNVPKIKQARGNGRGEMKGGGGTKCVCVYWSGHGGEKTKSHLSGMKVGCVQAINTREDGVGWDGMVVTSATARCGEQAGAAPVLFGRCDRSV